MSNSTPLLTQTAWSTSYRHDDGDLIELFYVPALRCAMRYDRMTGYFSADALALASRGIAALIRQGGCMRLLVGCTLDGDEIAAIAAGYDLRQKVAEKLAAVPLEPPDPAARQGLASLAWMVARGVLDIKVAVPVDRTGRPARVPGIYHEKVGVITDREGHQLSFSGSINETAGGWVNNRESFHVHCSWEGERERRHVQDEVEAFSRLWGNQSPSTRVFAFPEAALQRLLDFLPQDDRLIVADNRRAAADASRHPPTPLQTSENPSDDNHTPPTPEMTGQETAGQDDEAGERILPEEERRLVWLFIAHAARLTNGVCVGEKTSAVTAWPHQLHTSVRILTGWPCRLLICDEVGLGKTVSAGLAIRQAWLAGQAQRILILVPAGVMRQWQDELYEKFNLDVPIYDGQHLMWRATHGRETPLRQPVGRDAWTREPVVIASSHLMRRRDREAELRDAPPWELVVLDEAHHARRRGAGTSQDQGPNALLKRMQQLSSRCESLLLLTATPMQVHPVELWDLMSLLGLPAEWNSEVFLRYFELAGGNPSQAELVFLANLFRHTEAAFGPIDQTAADAVLPGLSELVRRRVLKALRDRSGIPLKRLDGPSRRAALELLRRFSPVRYRMSRHTRELLRLYHRRGLLPTPIATRQVADVTVQLSAAERALYDAVEDYISTTYNAASPDVRTAVGFVMTIYRRRLASSFHALRRTLEKRLAALDEPVADDWVDEADVSQDELADEVMDCSQAQAMVRQTENQDEREHIIDLLRRIARLGTDSKARQLTEQLKTAFADGYESALIFTQYADTLNYLKEYLAEQFPDMPVGCYSGDGGVRRDASGQWNACSKEQIKRALKDKNVRLLICTDAAGEGLNLQFTGVLVNYDLPWNPMKIEQRIGRIDRIGQQYPTIRIINLAYEDTVEADVYFAVGQRIQLFQGIVGKLQPILSRLPKQIEQVTLSHPAQRTAARQRLLADVQQTAASLSEGGFDIDEAAAEAAEMPSLPDPPLTQAGLDRVLNHDAYRPPAVEWQPLDRGSYKVRLPGMLGSVRATTSGEIFDDHCDSHLLLSPGGWFFQDIVRLATDGHGSSPGNEQQQGHLWLIESPDGACELILLTRDGPRRIETLDQLLDLLPRLGKPATLPPEHFAGSKLRLLA